MLQILNKIFSNPSISTAFSGFGIKIFEKIHKSKYVSNKIKITKKEIQYDIEEIKQSIAHPISTNQKAVSIHYFHKYKYLFLTNDIDILNNQFNSQSPDYCDILNTLLGLIESIK